MMDKYSPNAMQSSKHYFSLYPEPKIALSLSTNRDIYRFFWFYAQILRNSIAYAERIFAKNCTEKKNEIKT